jgi:hypothetical protein
MRINLDIGVRTGKVCMFNDSDLCEPLNFNRYESRLEHAGIARSLEMNFPGSNSNFDTIDMNNIEIEQIDEVKRPGLIKKKAEWWKTFNEVKMEFESLFCMSGICKPNSVGHGRCLPEPRDLSQVTIPFHEVNSKYIKLHKDVALFLAMSSSCSGRMNVDTGSIQLTPSSPVKTVYVCRRETNYPCFPQNKEEVKKYMEAEGKQGELNLDILLKEGEKYSPQTDERGEPVEKTMDCDPQILFWFCDSGKCGADDRCAEGPWKEDTVLKLWEMKKCEKSRGSKFPVSPTRLLSAIALVLILLSSY